MPDLIVVRSNAMDLDVASGGVFAQHGATAQIARAQLHALDYAGAFAGTGAALSLTDVTIEDVRRQPCAPDAAACALTCAHGTVTLDQ